MAAEWPTVRLGQYVDACLGKMLDAKKNKGELQPYLGNSNVRWGQFDLSELAQMKFEATEEERYSLRPGDLVVCEGGEPGRCAIWRGPSGMKIQKALHRVRGTNGLSNEFLYYWLTFASRSGLLEPHFTGTTIKHLTGRALASLAIPLPPPDAQRALVDVLAPLDARIDHLRQTNATLEAIAQALFKSWFVDFDPVRAKAKGREPDGMDAATAALFPSGFEDSELGPIPKGWRVLALPEVIEINPKRVLKKGTISKYLDMAAVPTMGHVAESPATRVFASGSKFCNGDTLLARITPCLENGKTAYVDFLHDGEVASGSTEFIVLRPREPLPAYFGYLLARQKQFREFAIQAMSGTSGRQRVEVGRLEQFRIVAPDHAVARGFGDVVGPVCRSIRSNADLMERLAELRDTLLPRLISGKLRLPGGRAIANEAAA